jgi:hypothetical protein
MTVGPTVLAMTQRPTDEDESDLLSVSPAGQLIGVSASALIRYEAQGLIRSIRTPGGHRRYRRADVEALVAGGGQAADKSGPDPEQPPRRPTRARWPSRLYVAGD